MLTLRDLTQYDKFSTKQNEGESSRMVSTTVTQNMLNPLACVETFLRSILIATNPQQVKLFCALIERTVK